MKLPFTSPSFLPSPSLSSLSLPFFLCFVEEFSSFLKVVWMPIGQKNLRFPCRPNTKMERRPKRSSFREKITVRLKWKCVDVLMCQQKQQTSRRMEAATMQLSSVEQPSNSRVHYEHRQSRCIYTADTSDSITTVWFRDAEMMRKSICPPGSPSTSLYS